MPKSSRLRAADVRAVFELAGECRDLGDDPAVWWTHYSRRLAGLAGADFAGCGQVAGPLRTGAETLGIGEWGWENGFDREPWDRSVELFGVDPSYTELYPLYFDRLDADDGVCLARTDLMPDAEWAASVSFRQINEPMGLDHYVWCYRARPGPAGGHGVAVLGRALGRPDFTPHDKAVVREAHAQVTALIGGPLAGFRDPAPSDLPPQPKRVLRCLLEGDSDKQVAARLGIAEHTARQYAKHVFRHFGVGGRAELLARWLKRGWNSRCVWADDADGRSGLPSRPESVPIAAADGPRARTH